MSLTAHKIGFILLKQNVNCKITLISLPFETFHINRLAWDIYNPLSFLGPMRVIENKTILIDFQL